MNSSDLITVSTERRGDVDVLAVTGEVDAVTAPALQRAIDAVIGSGKPLIIDMSAVTFLGSVGLRILVSTQQRLGANLGFAVVADGAATSQVIELTRLDEAFQMCATLDDALRHVRNG